MFLHDHVHFDGRGPDGAENLGGHARLVGYAEQGQFGGISGVGQTRHEGLLHGGFLRGNQGAGTLFVEAGQHPQRDTVLADEFQRARMQYFGAQAGEFHHFFKSDGIEQASVFDDARVGGIDAGDIGVDLAFIGIERGGDRNGGGIGAATAEGGDSATGGDALEAGDHRRSAGVEIGAQAV